MPIDRPFRRNVRPVVEGKNSGWSSWAYIRDPEYASAPAHYVRAYLLIEEELKSLFVSVEPASESLATYSFRIHGLLMRVCIEIEANMRAILSDNGYKPREDRFGRPVLNMMVYRKIEYSHHLSSYEVGLPLWRGGDRIMKPFQSWRESNSLDWYQAYNESKHDRQDAFTKANIKNLLNAVGALLILITAQFGTESFSKGADHLALTDSWNDGMSSTVGSIFRIKHPDDWPEAEMYAFDWNELKERKDRFLSYDYTDA